VRRTTPTLDAVLLAVAVLAVSTSGPLVREAAAPTLAIAFWRTTLASAVILPVAALRNRDELRGLTRNELRTAAIAGVFLTLHFGCWIPSLSFTSVASSVALTCTQPVWAAVMARVRGEHIARGAWFGIGVALLGALLLTGIDFTVSSRALFGDGLALAGGIFGAAYVTVGADARRAMSTTAYTSVCYPLAGVALLAVCLATRQNLGHYSAHTWWIILAITIGPQLLGHSLVNRVLRTISATTVSVAILFEIVGATLVAWWWFSETPPNGAYPAAVLIAIGVVLVVRAGNTAAPPVE
jgi:drug/metabolite transporter (DMT)-like permease